MVVPIRRRIRPKLLQLPKGDVEQYVGEFLHNMRGRSIPLISVRFGLVPLNINTAPVPLGWRTAHHCMVQVPSIWCPSRIWLGLTAGLTRTHSQGNTVITLAPLHVIIGQCLFWSHTRMHTHTPARERALAQNTHARNPSTPTHIHTIVV